ncbi:MULTISPECIES: lipocalin family protein [unclassified Acidovorax]|uniref:lipocalin family protein n=1 Tax=unclassified Acidovorax TaxID=2684926 RepID=UPI002303D95F|nr:MULTISPECIES: lipocalin family protein [unclassified Acidovorax]
MPRPELQRYTTHRRMSATGPLAVGVAAAAAGAAVALYLRSNVQPPPGVRPVKGFNVDRYAGHWYEVARIDQRFERGLIRTSAHYSRRGDGSIRVVNRGYDPEQRRWHEVEGRARFLGDTDTGALKVSFFGPFYAGYFVEALDEDYRWAMVVGPRLDAFWILSRTPMLPGAVRERLLARARSLGVDVRRILWVAQADASAPDPAPR